MSTKLKQAQPIFQRAYQEFLTKTSVGRYFDKHEFDKKTNFFIGDLPEDHRGEARSAGKTGKSKHEIFIDIDYILNNKNNGAAIIDVIADEAMHVMTKYDKNSMQEEYTSNFAGGLSSYEYKGMGWDKDPGFMEINKGYSQLYAYERWAEGLPSNPKDAMLDLFRTIFPKTQHPIAYQYWNDGLAEINNAVKK
jgi:hypothetical protein